MASCDEFFCHRSVRPLDMLLGIVTSILLHSILLMGSKYWHRALMREPNQEITQEIPIEVVEVPLNKTDIPPQTSLRATKNSIAGGKALPEKPVSAMKSANPIGHKASSESSFDLTPSSSAEVFQPERQQQKTASPNLSRQQLQLKPRKTVLAPTTTVKVPNFKKIAVAPITTPSPAPLKKTALERATTLPVPSNPKNLGQSKTRLNGRTPSQARSSPKTGAASLLGGTLSVSSRNYRSDDLAALPNSNRDHQATPGIDARSQDIDLTFYLKKLQQRVQQEWLPGLSDSNRRTVLNFTINRSGQVSNLNIAQTSGFSVTDEVALNAIQRTAPFAPLPTGYSKNYINIEFTFDINVYGQLNLWRDGG
ncbi:energy transducer TonB [Nostoc sp.]|uniref:energy transducer TonB n=1 Tax=Nostoc sp. TaxID=1180 RepID=UPI002FF6B467